MNPLTNIILKQMEIGPLANFQYFLGDPQTKEIAVVDPAWDVGYLLHEAQENGYTISQIWLTHGHDDHVNGLDEMLDIHDVPVFISKHEAPFLIPKCKNLNLVESGDKLKIGSIEFDTILMPGHTPGCHSFKHGDTLIAGDVVFIDGCGRCDLAGGDATAMYHSLHDILMKLPDSTTIYPGHNYGPAPYATLGEQKKTNPYLQATDIDDFLHARMGM